jgi:DNA-binding LytR/AlgR family response regulator
MKILIIEDETRAANRLEKLIFKLKPGATILGKFESVRDSVHFLSNNPAPDLILSDIQLADGLSFEIFKKNPVQCPIIFTTAYDQYAIEAFNTNGIDYLLKPIEEERLAKALEKLQKLTSQQPNLEAVVELLNQKTIPDRTYKSRFMVKVGEQIKIIQTEKIRAFYSFDRATFILTEDQHNYIIDYSLEQLEEMLDPSRFFRVNRKYFVGLEACSKIYAWSNSRLKIEVDGIDEDVVVARERVGKFKEWLDA